MITDLKDKGYTIIPNVLTTDEITHSKKLFYQWIDKIPGIKEFHSIENPYGIFRYHQSGHQEHAWYIRTRSAVQKPFHEFYNCDDLIVSYDAPVKRISITAEFQTCG